MATVANIPSLSPHASDFGPPEPSGGVHLEDMLHPALGFDHPRDVVDDPDLTRAEKRAILASWASDLRAVEANPALRRGPRGRPVEFDDIVLALRALDRQGRHTRTPGLFTRRAATLSGRDV